MDIVIYTTIGFFHFFLRSFFHYSNSISNSQFYILLYTKIFYFDAISIGLIFLLSN